MVSNDCAMTERELLLAYKGQPAIERRFEQMKTDFVVAPVYLKEVSRIQALLCVNSIPIIRTMLPAPIRRELLDRAAGDDFVENGFLIAGFAKDASQALDVLADGA